MRRSVFSLALATALWPLGVGAQPLRLTEAEALARLSAESPRVRALRAPIEIARVDVMAAARWPNPSVSLMREAVSGTAEYLTTVSQPLPITGRRRLDGQAAAATVAAADSRTDDEVRRLRGDLRLAFAALIAAQDRERELVAAKDRLRSLAELLARREAAGDAAGFDRLRAEREVLELEADLATAAVDRVRAQGRLASFMADISDPLRLIATGGAVTSSGDLPPLDALVEKAETARGALLALRHEREAADFAARAAERTRIPEPTLVGGTKVATVAGGDVGSVVGVNATVALFDRARPERALAAARASQAALQAAAFRVTLRGEIAALRAVVVERRRAAGAYRADAIASATAIERIAQIGYDAGERGILELLDAYRLGASARVRQTTLDLAVRQAEIELEFSTGWEMPL